MYSYLHLPEDDSEKEIFLCFDCELTKTYDYTLKDVQLIVTAYCHKDYMDYELEGYTGNRIDILCDAVNRVLLDSRDFGIGRLKLETVTLLNEKNTYYGKVLTYKTTDFSNQGRH